MKLLGIVAALCFAALASVNAYAVVNLNTASQSELESVKGLGPAKAKAIIAHREKQGLFKSVDELDQVKGFGKATVNKLRPELTVGSSTGKR